MVASFLVGGLFAVFPEYQQRFSLCHALFAGSGDFFSQWVGRVAK
jgi:hypothetical protein